MLNRRLLRIKVLQIIYAHTFSNEKPVFESEKELLFSVGKSHELYLLILELWNQMKLLNIYININ